MPGTSAGGGKASDRGDAVAMRQQWRSANSKLKTAVVSKNEHRERNGAITMVYSVP
jgi:hypothetical protein